jgi:hypothetical protein
MDMIVNYGVFEIRVFEDEFIFWRSEIRKIDGSLIKTASGDEVPSIALPSDCLNSAEAIRRAKQMIDKSKLRELNPGS